MPGTFREVIDLFAKHREAALCTSLRNNVHLVAFEPGRIELRPGPHAPRDLASRTATRLTDWTGERWVVAISGEEGAPTLVQQDEASEQAAKNAVEALPLVQSIKKAFPGATVSKVNLKLLLADEDMLLVDDELEEED